MAKMINKITAKAVDLGFDNAADFDMLTAASLGDFKRIKFLVESGHCHVDVVNTSGWTALMYASNYGFYHVVRLLIDFKANVNKQEKLNGRTALMLAASNGHTKCIETLINYGNASLDIVDKYGNTATYYAIHSGHGANKIISQLLKTTSTPRVITKLTGSPKVLFKEREANQAAVKQSNYSAELTPNQQFLNYKLRKMSSEPRKVEKRDFVDRGHVDINQNYYFTENRSVHYQSQKLTCTYQEKGKCPSINEESFASECNSLPLPATLEEFLSRIGLVQYLELFLINDVDLHTLITFTENDLKRIGIHSIGHRSRISTAQRRFRESIEIRSTQEKFLADFLLNKCEQLEEEIQYLRSIIDKRKLDDH